MIKSILQCSTLKQNTRSFSILLRSTLVSATDKAGEGLTGGQGHSSNSIRELSFEQQYSAKRDYELLKKLADLSQDQSKKVATLFDKIDASNRINADLQNLQHNANEMQGIIDESLADTRVANIDVTQQEEQTPWRSHSKSQQQPKTIQNIENMSGSTMGTTNDQNASHQTKFMDKSFYPDLTNDL